VQFYYIKYIKYAIKKFNHAAMRKIIIEVNEKTIGTKLKCQLPDIKMQNLIINKKCIDLC